MWKREKIRTQVFRFHCPILALTQMNTFLIEEFHSPGNRLKAGDKTGLLNASLDVSTKSELRNLRIEGGTKDPSVDMSPSCPLLVVTLSQLCLLGTRSSPLQVVQSTQAILIVRERPHLDSGTSLLGMHSLDLTVLPGTT